MGGPGGAVFCDNGSPSFLECSFSGNHATVAPGGGGIACTNGSNPGITYCAFTDNYANASGCYGGAMYVAESNPLVTHCTFTSNRAGPGGGGNAIACNAAGLILTHSVFHLNSPSSSSAYGGGVHAVNSHVVVRNCEFSQNNGQMGGAAYADSSRLMIYNSTLAHNGSTSSGRTLYCKNNSSADIANSIIWGDVGGQIFLIGDSTVDVNYCDWKGWDGSGTGNMDADPLFVGVGPRPFCLKQPPESPTSPCVDAGNTTAATAGLRSYSTRTDRGLDIDELDLGYHYPRDCDGSGTEDPLEILTGVVEDCNHNNVPDSCDIADGTSPDADADGVPDDCETCPEEPAQYTTAAEFGTGTLINVYVDNPNPAIPQEARLQRYEHARPLPYLNVALSGTEDGPFGRLARIRTDVTSPNDAILAEYYTAPGKRGNPSRTAVDLDGNVWVANRYDPETGAEDGSVTRIGLLVGGTRCDASGVPDAEGEYLKPPFAYNTCSDRDGDGLIHTSQPLNATTRIVLDWPGDYTFADEMQAEDECVCKYVRVSAENTRHVSIDVDNNLWAGGYIDNDFDHVDSFSGSILSHFTVRDALQQGLGGYGGLIDGHGVIWSTDSAGYYPGGSVLRYDTAADPPAWTPLVATEAYGLTMDANGCIWVSEKSENTLQKFLPGGAAFFGTEQHPQHPPAGEGIWPKGLAVTLDDNNVWVAKSESNYVVRLGPDGQFVKTIDIFDEEEVHPGGLNKPTALAVDSEGKVWVACRNLDTVKRIDPDGGPDSLGQLDLTIRQDQLGFGGPAVQFWQHDRGRHVACDGSRNVECRSR
jgi:predicted outer membrane repeat protein